MFPTDLCVRHQRYDYAKETLLFEFNGPCVLSPRLSRTVGPHVIFAFVQVPPSNEPQMIVHEHSMIMILEEPFIQHCAEPYIRPRAERICYHAIRFSVRDAAYHCAYAIKNCGGALFVVMFNTFPTESPCTGIPMPTMITAAHTEAAADEIVKRVFCVEEEWYKVGSEAIVYGLPQFRFGMTYPVTIIGLSHTNACADVCDVRGVKICSVSLHNLARKENPRPCILKTPDGDIRSVCIDQVSFKMAGIAHIETIIAMIQHQIDLPYLHLSKSEAAERMNKVCFDCFHVSCLHVIVFADHIQTL